MTTWTAEEDARVESAAARNLELGVRRPGRLVELADALGRSYGSVRRRASELEARSMGLGRRPRPAPVRGRNHRWTPEEDAELLGIEARRGNNRDSPIRAFAERVGTTYANARRRRARLRDGTGGR